MLDVGSGNVVGIAQAGIAGDDLDSALQGFVLLQLFVVESDLLIGGQHVVLSLNGTFKFLVQPICIERINRNRYARRMWIVGSALANHQRFLDIERNL